MNNIVNINELNLYNNQRKTYIEFDTQLKQVDTTDNQALDQAVLDIKHFIKHMTGRKLSSIVPVKNYVLDHRQMEEAIAWGLQCYGMKGATDFDNENMAMTMLNAPVRDYHHRYFIAPRFRRLANLNTDNGQAVQALWEATLHALTNFYGKKKSTV